MYRIVSEVTALGKMFETFGIEYYYWNHANQAYMFPQSIKDFYADNFSWIDNPREIPNTEGNILGWKYSRISATDGHPSFQGHQELANIIYEKIKAKR